MKTDNELIAEFMGEVLTDEDHAHNLTLDQLPYRTNWNWLMPVVEKINRLDDQIHLNIRGIELIRTHRKRLETIYYEAFGRLAKTSLVSSHYPRNRQQ